jgi:hypothetical protein
MRKMINPAAAVDDVKVGQIALVYGTGYGHNCIGEPGTYKLDSIMRVVEKKSPTQFIVRSLTATAQAAWAGPLGSGDFLVSSKCVYTVNRLRRLANGNPRRFRLSAGALSTMQTAVDSVFPRPKITDDLKITGTVVRFIWDWGAIDPDRVKIIKGKVGLNEKIGRPGLSGVTDEPYHFYGLIAPKTYVNEEKLLVDCDTWLENGRYKFKILDFTEGIFAPANIVEYLSADTIFSSSKPDPDVDPTLYDRLIKSLLGGVRDEKIYR